MLRGLSQVSLTKRFALVSFGVLIAGMLVIGWWVSRQIESGVMRRTSSVTASYVTSAVSPHLQGLGEAGQVGLEQMGALDSLLRETELGQRIVSFKVWGPDGRILYSPQRALVGESYQVGGSLQRALAGETVSHISDLSDPENSYERQRFSQLQETYTPLRQFGSGEIMGAVEFYEGTEALATEIQAARLRSWLIVGAATLAMYLLLVGLVKGASLTIGSQRRQLEERVSQLDRAVAHNQALNRQLTAIAAVATAANETPDLERAMGRCLEVTLEQTDFESGVIRLVDGSGTGLAVAGARGELSALPCSSQAVGFEDCPCGHVASTGSPLYLDPSERQRFQPPCRAPGSYSVVVLPLKTSKEVLGVLQLSRRRAGGPSSEERETLEAISNQIATAIENSRLMDEVGRMEAQRELDHMKNEFISAISHELRTPLGFIKGYATTLLRKDTAADPIVRREFLEVIDEESSKLQRMIDDLLDASRLQAGRFSINRAAVSLNATLEVALHKAAPSLQQAGHVLETRLAPNDVQVLADAGRIEQVLDNLLDNASRYSDQGTPVLVAAEVRERDVVVSVTDHGHGIPAHQQKMIFEPFYRGESARRRVAQGTGLGLTICKGIIESHGGKLWVESSMGMGSTFSFTLPLATAGRVGEQEQA